MIRHVTVRLSDVQFKRVADIAEQESISSDQVLLEAVDIGLKVLEERRLWSYRLQILEEARRRLERFQLYEGSLVEERGWSEEGPSQLPDPTRRSAKGAPELGV